MSKKSKEKAIVISQKELVSGIFDLWLETNQAKEAHAGQFIGVYPKNAATILPRPISICEVDKNRNALRLVYRVAGKGTKEFSTLKKGDEVDILGILGNGYALQDILNGERSSDKRPVLLGGGIGIPPMLQLAKELTHAGVKPVVIAGYRDKNLFLQQDFEKYSDFYIATEDGSVGTKGNVLTAMEEQKLLPTVIMACGPMPMLRAVKAASEKYEVPAYISLEERMACGVGACLGCVCKTTKQDAHSHVHNARICTDGPVFLAEDVEI